MTNYNWLLWIILRFCGILPENKNSELLKKEKNVYIFLKDKRRTGGEFLKMIQWVCLMALHCKLCLSYQLWDLSVFLATGGGGPGWGGPPQQMGKFADRFCRRCTVPFLSKSKWQWCQWTASGTSVTKRAEKKKCDLQQNDEQFEEMARALNLWSKINDRVPMVVENLEKS